MNRREQVDKKAAQARHDGIFQNPRKESECQGREWTYLLGLAVGRMRPGAAKRGVFMASL